MKLRKSSRIAKWLLQSRNGCPTAANGNAAGPERDGGMNYGMFAQIGRHRRNKLRKAFALRWSS